ncbi:hypothetical protein EZZ76_08730 [Neisseria meningitidis]|nr:hypothetical protein [Neisseria meningitidis]
MSVRVRPWAPQPLLERLFFCLLLFNEIDKTKYSGLNLNQYGVASPYRTICTVCGLPPCPDFCYPCPDFC